ncbi:MAG: TetR/AcrR family transcriptional regulator [Porticoccaceae bacterium]|nr:TetR/AcrR family transcriptional regulator [Porticoccaceae bacterium]
MPRAPEYNRQHVLEAAMSVFWRDGYEATSIYKLIEATEINRGSLYQAFGSKAGLFHEVMDHYVSHFEVPLNGYLEIADPIIAIRSLFYALLLVDNDEYRSRGCLLFNTVSELSHTEPEMAQAAAARLSILEDLFEKRLVEAREKGLMPDNNPASVCVAYLMALAGGLRLQSKMGASRETLRSMIKIGLESILPNSSQNVVELNFRPLH